MALDAPLRYGCDEDALMSRSREYEVNRRKRAHHVLASSAKEDDGN